MFLKVGCTTMSSEEALKAGLRGKALRITHYYRDFLWYMRCACFFLFFLLSLKEFSFLNAEGVSQGIS